jgi:hypothetical protein
MIPYKYKVLTQIKHLNLLIIVSGDKNFIMVLSFFFLGFELRALCL